MIWFDIGNTLFFPATDVGSPARQISRQFGLAGVQRVALEQWFMTATITSVEQFRTRLWRWLPHFDPPLPAGHDIDAIAARIWAQQMTTGRWSETAIRLLGALRERHIAYGFISNIWHPYFDAFRRQQPELVDGCPCLLSYQEGLAKPNLALFRRAAACGRSAFVVGDSYYKDIVPARQCGMGTIYFQPSENTGQKSKYPEATYIVTDLRAVLSIIERHDIQAFVA